jgi:hypothetical protein
MHQQSGDSAPPCSESAVEYEFRGTREPLERPFAHAAAPHHHFNDAHVSLGSINYGIGAVAAMLLAEKSETPEQRHLGRGGGRNGVGSRGNRGA